MFDFLKKEKEEVLMAPINGKMISLEEVPDQVFASKMMGDGFGFINDSNKVYSPCDAEVTVLHSSKHAIGLRTKIGAEILIHIGLDTVNLNGEGFSVCVSKGQKVKKGDLLITYDKEFMIKKNINLITPLVITNYNDLKIEKIGNLGDVNVQTEILKIRK